MLPIKPLTFQSQGFTLLELIIVILLIGIMSVTMLPRSFQTELNVEQEARRVLNTIRFTQGLSMASGQRYRWVRVSANAYQILNEAGNPIVFPSGGTQLTLSSGISVSTSLPNNLVAFDSQGIPYSDAGWPGTALSATASISVAGGGRTRVIMITPQTGYGFLS